MVLAIQLIKLCNACCVVLCTDFLIMSSLVDIFLIIHFDIVI